MSRSSWIQLLCGFALLFCGLGCSSASSIPFFGSANQLGVDAKAMLASPPHVGGVSRELAKGVSEPYVVEPGDVLLVQPAKFDSPVRLPGDQPVLPDGSLYLGEYGRIQAAGKQLDWIEKEVQALIDSREKEAGAITVRLVSRQSKVYYVLGEVNAPGSFVLSGRETVLDALMMAGGVTDEASRNKILLSRPTTPQSCRVVLPVFYDDIVQLGDTTTNYQIRAGDRIFVPSSTLWETLFGGHHQSGNVQVPCAHLEGEAVCAEPPVLMSPPRAGEFVAPVAPTAAPGKVEAPTKSAAPERLRVFPRLRGR